MRMYKLVIVDDEPIVRLALQAMIDWKSEGVTIAGEASDGIDALELLRRDKEIDILLVDIEMPRLGGIGLLRAIAEDEELSGRVVPVILSAYSDYSYVREAFVLGALDYIVKADMDEKPIVAVIRKAIQQSERLRAKLAAETDEVVREVLVSAGDGRRESLLGQLLIREDGKSSDSEVERLALELGEKWKTNVVVSVLQLARSSSDEKTHSFIRQTIASVMHESGLPYELCRTGQNEYALLCTFQEECSQSIIYRNLHSTLGLILSRLLQFVNLSISIGVSELGYHKRCWTTMFQQAREMAEQRYFAGYGHIFFMSAGAGAQGQSKRASTMKDAAENAKESQELRGKLMAELKGAGKAQWSQAWESLCELLQETTSRKPEEAKSFLGDLLWELGSLLYSQGQRWEDIEGIEGSSSQPHEALQACETFAESKAVLTDILKQVHNHLHPSTGAASARVYSSPVAQAKKFLDEHYCEDVNLSLLSNMVGVSESYLSKQFLKEVGCNFIHYLTRLRMEEAKRLLHRNVKIIEIAERIGYWNPEHFSRLFKKTTGITPKDYKKHSATS